MLARILIPVLFVAVSVGAHALESPRETPFRLERTRVRQRHVRYEFAVQQRPDGVPVFDWAGFRREPERQVTTGRDAIVLENRTVRVTLIPSMGRVHSFVHKPSGQEQLWINPSAIPIPAHNDTGFWVTWGGVEYVLPRGEHGTSHALRWQHVVEENSPVRKTVRVWTREPLTGLEHALVFSLYPDRNYLETRVSLRNPGTEEVRFSHWTTAVLAPGGTGQLTPRTEFVVPAARFVAADKPFNRWMNGLLGHPRTSPLRFADAWKDIGDLMATPLEKPFFAAYSHERDAAVVRQVDPAGLTGFNIWTWGYPPDEKRQREYTAQPPNLGYAEFWNGTARDFTDGARSTLRPGERLQWRERMAAVVGLGRPADLVAALEPACR